VGFCESGDKISFCTNAENYLTSLGTNVFALQEGVCYTGVALYGTPVRNPKPPVNFAGTHNRCVHPSDETREANSVTIHCCKPVANRVPETTFIFLHFEKKRIIIRNANIQG